MSQTTYTLKAIPNGVAGTKETLRQMARLVRAYKKHPLIFRLSRQITKDIPQKDWVGEAKAIHAFVRDRIRYVKDIDGVETLQTPPKTVEIGCGDCDDKSTLAGALLQSIGHPVRFVVVGQAPGKFAHVYLETKIKNRWFPVETTEPWEFGEVKKKLPYRGVYYV